MLRSNQGALLVCLASGLRSPQQRLRWWREGESPDHTHPAPTWWVEPMMEGGGAYSTFSVQEASPGTELWCGTEQGGRSYKAKGC